MMLFWLSIPIFASLLTLLIAILGFRALARSQEIAADRESARAEKAAMRVEMVKADLILSDRAARNYQSKQEEHLVRLQQVGDDTHTLVNSAMSQQMRMTANKCRQIANLTKDPLDIMEADAADEALAIHLKKQDKVDKVVQARMDATKPKIDEIDEEDEIDEIDRVVQAQMDTTKPKPLN